MAKSFKDKIQEKAKAPEAMRYISTPPPVDPEPEPRPQPERKPKKRASASTSTPRKAATPARRAIPEYEETKSRRLQLLLTPSLYEAVKDKAAEARLSVNEYINSILKDAVSRK